MLPISSNGTVYTVILMCLFLVSFPVSADKPAGSEYLEAEKSEFALILCHGRGKHPKWKVVEPLRNAVNQKMGWHTLSLQMPAQDKHWLQYAEDFPKAFEQIEQGITFLKLEKNVKYIFLMGHSMGSRMASAYLAENANPIVKGIIVAGIRNNGGYPLNEAVEKHILERKNLASGFSKCSLIHIFLI